MIDHVAVAAFAAGLSAFAADAAAQGAGPYYDDDSVIVDLSVLDDGGFGRRPATLPPAGIVPGITGTPQMPGTEPPRSRFHGLAPSTGQTAALARPPAAKSRPAAPPAKSAAAAPARSAQVPAERRPSAPAPMAAVTPEQIPARPPPPPVIVAMPPPSPPPAAAPAPQPGAPPPPPVIAAPEPAAPPRAIAPPPASPVASVPVPPAPPAARPAPAEPPSQAALPLAPAAPPTDRVLQIVFPADDSRLPASAQAGLKEIAGRMKAKDSLRLQLTAYAAGGELSASAARRLSLSRALAARTYLIDNGVRSTRIDVRALGDKVPDQPANRVDVSLSER